MSENSWGLVAIKREWIPDWLFAACRWIIPIYPFRWLFTKKVKYETFVSDDLIIPMLKFESPCQITVTIADHEVHLSIGNRDMTWNRRTGTMTDAGTLIEYDHHD
jgi:hypothetical protein